MAKLDVSSLNCQGLGNYKKRRDVFQYLRQKKFDIYFLQDTHFEPRMEKQIRAEWGYECYFSSFNSQSRGVAILINNTFDFKVTSTYHDQMGNLLIVCIKTNDIEATLINVYGPNRDNPEFYSKIQKQILEEGYSNIIWGGDWNLVLDPTKDYDNYKHVNNPKSKEKVNEITTILNLVDIWREINPDIKRFTWRRKNPFQQARLDFFLISESLLSFVKHVDILAGYRSDHSLINITLEMNKENKNKNYWKFNSSLLKDKVCIEKIGDTIKRIKKQYAVPVYNIDEIENIPLQELGLTISDQLFLDVLLMEIRSTVFSYSITKSKTNKANEKRLEESIEKLESNQNKTDVIIQELEEAKNELQNIRKEKIEGIILRSKARWASQGEKVTKYFCNLEKRHYLSKQMFKLTDEDGTSTNITEDMIEKTRCFYEKLYKRREVTDYNLEEYILNLPRLNNQERESLEGEIHLKEASAALKNMKNGKSPGTDGMTVEFFKFFWKQIGAFVVRSLNEGFRINQMSITQREGIIICIPKGDKPREYLKNWRPISLLNVVYKIGSTCIANRLKTILPTLIHEDQTGFVPGRYIGDNIRLIYDMIHYLDTEDSPGLLVTIDFEKAFDSVDWDFMHKVLKRFGFGRDICRWVSAFYSNITSNVLVNGKPSNKIKIERGCRQGDPISPYLFILCAEILACKIREDTEIKPIRIGNSDFKISQFADDTSFLLEGDKKSYERLFYNLDEFAGMSGLKLNFEKTCNVWLGANKRLKTKWLPHLNMSWNPDKFKILGLWFTNNLEKMAELNLKDKFNEVKILFDLWMRRSNTPIGRVVVLKSLILSKLIYLWILLPNPPDDFVKDIQKRCFDFVWDGKRDKIKRSNAIHAIRDGGINIPDIKAYIRSLKIKWLSKLTEDSPPKWYSIVLNQCPEIRRFKAFGSEFLLDKFKNPFWKDVYDAYYSLERKVNLRTSEDLLAEPLFYNHRFKIRNKPFYYHNWAQNQILKVKDLIKEDGSFLTLAEFQDEYANASNFLDFYSCIRVIKSFMKENGIELSGNIRSDNTKTLSLIYQNKRGAKTFYTCLLEKIEKATPCKNWEMKLGKNINWNNIFKLINKTKETQLK